MTDWLIVMRDELQPEIYEAMAEIEGKTTLLFYDPVEALDWIDKVDAQGNAESLPALALMNVFFPGERHQKQRGLLVGERLRQSPLLNNIAIILTDTGRYDMQMQQDFMDKAKADLFLYMPMPKFKDLMALFEQEIQKRQQRTDT